MFFMAHIHMIVLHVSVSCKGTFGESTLVSTEHEHQNMHKILYAKMCVHENMLSIIAITIIAVQPCT